MGKPAEVKDYVRRQRALGSGVDQSPCDPMRCASEGARALEYTSEFKSTGGKPPLANSTQVGRKGKRVESVKPLISSAIDWCVPTIRPLILARPIPTRLMPSALSLAPRRALNYYLTRRTTRLRQYSALVEQGLII